MVQLPACGNPRNGMRKRRKQEDRRIWKDRSMWNDVRRKEVVRAHALAHAFRHPAILQNGRPRRVHSSPLGYKWGACNQ